MKDEVKTVSLTDPVAEDSEVAKSLFSLVKDAEGKYFIDNERQQNNDKLWLVVRAMKNETGKLSYELKKNDIIKLGRIQFRVKDLQTETIKKNDPKDIIMNDDIEEVKSLITSNDSSPKASETSAVPQCRF